MKDVLYQNGVFRMAKPDSQGVPSRAVLEFLKELERQSVDIQSLYIFRNGYQLVGANRKPYQADTPRRIYSAAKALTGLAVLFAVQEGLVSLDTHLTEIFPESLPDPMTDRVQALTVRHLLTMTTGHGQDTFRPVINETDSVRAFLEQPLEYEPGTYFLYNNGVPHILGRIVQKVSGFDYIEYLKPRFLEPLEIFCTVEQTERGELEGSRTVCTAEGFAKLTLFYLQEGSWNGKQRLDRELVREAGARQVMTGRCPSISFMHTDQMAGYGYQVWRNSREGFRLDGGRSQFGFVFPEKQMAVVCNAIEEDSGLIPAVFWNTLYPQLQDGPLAETEETKRYGDLLKEHLEGWSCAPELSPYPSFLDDYYERTYRLEENPWHLTTLSVSLRDGRPQIGLGDETRRYMVICGLNGEWEKNLDFPPMPKENERLNQIFGIESPAYWVSGGWASDFCFVFQVRATDWMDYHTFYCRFHGKRLSLCIEANVEKLSHLRKRIPIKPWKYPDAPVEGLRAEE